MNKLFEDDLIARLEETWGRVETGNQCFIESVLKDWAPEFPMISFEENSDDGFLVELEESSFLKNPSHRGFWIVGWDEDEVSFIFNLKDRYGSLEIDAFEINYNERGLGVGSNVISVIESVAENYYDDIIVSPFDTSAMNFWEHMEYTEGKNGYWIKRT